MSRPVAGRRLALTAAALILAVTLAHGWAVQGHRAEAAEQAEMAEHGQVEGRIAWLLAGSVTVGLALVSWGLLAIRWGRRLAPWAAVTLAAHVLFLAAGISSRTTWGLLGHTDQPSRLWALTLTAEAAVCLLTAATWAASRAAGARAGVARRLDLSPIP